MLEWTGERFLPWVNDSALAYEHLHRYMYASQFVCGKSVLDLASGEGYGSNILAETAAQVVGVDLDPKAVEHASGRYTRDNLKFYTGSITEVPIAGTALFDVVVCYEAMEHIEHQDALMDEILRLLKPDGKLIVSTPNKTVYNDSNPGPNEFHVKELEFDEFRNLLEQRFHHVRFFGQKLYAGSALWRMPQDGDPSTRHYVIRKQGEEFGRIGADGRKPMYFIALASNAPLEVEGAASVLVDDGNALLLEKDSQIRELLAARANAEEAIQWQKEQIENREEIIRERQATILDREQMEHALQETLDRTTASLHQCESTIASQEQALEWRASQIADFETKVGRLNSDLEDTLKELTHTRTQLEATYESSAWKLALKLGRFADALCPPGTGRRRFLHRIVRNMTD